MKSESRRLDSLEIQEELISKLESLFSRENLEKSTYFIARMNDKMEIPLQVVYQQKEIYRICPNGRYVLQALRKCKNVTVHAEQLVVIPNIVPKKLRVQIKITTAKEPISLEAVIAHIKNNSGIPIVFVKTLNSQSAFLVVETEDQANALNEWISNNLIQNEPVEHSIKEESIVKQFRFNVKEDLAKYKEKLNGDKRLQGEMISNFEFFQHPAKNIVSQDASKSGEPIFANPYNYFFSVPQEDVTHQQQQQQQPTHFTRQQTLEYQQQQQAAFTQYAFLMYQQMQEQMTNQQGNNLRSSRNQNSNNKSNKRNTRSKSRGVNENTNSTNATSGASNSEKKPRKPRRSSKDNATGTTTTTTDNKQSPKKTTDKSKKSKSQKFTDNSEASFPSLSGAPIQTNKSNEWTAADSSKDQPALPATAPVVERKTRKLSAEKQVTISENAPHADRKVSESREKVSNRQVSESRERQQQPQRKQSVNAKEEVIYVRKAKDIKTTYEKNALLEIFLKIKDTITPPTSIVESSKDEFIPVINLSAPKEIELTKPTEVIEHHSNPGTPYQGQATIPYRKSSISRSNIKRKESERIVEVDEGKVL